MVQSMIRNDPRFANNPMLQTLMQELADNPRMASEISQMMRDPMVARQIEQMRATQPGLTPTTGSNNATNANPASMMQMAQMLQMMQQTGAGTRQQANANQRPPNGSETNDADDADITEEEMIAEAIRRSLQDS